jgi:hypothetical protein
MNQFVSKILQRMLLETDWACELARKNQMRKSRNSKPVVHFRRPKCSQLFIIYGGMDGFLSRGMIAGLGLLPFLKASGMGDRNLIWVRDPYADNLQQGISPEVPDVAALADWHRQQIAALPMVNEVYAIGYSSGCYGAMLFGHLWGFKKVWGFSPRTARVRTDAAMKAALRDQLLTHNGVTEFELGFADENRADRLFAETMSDCPGVTVRPYEGYGATHFLMTALVNNGKFRAMLPPLASATASVTSAPAEAQRGG